MATRAELHQRIDALPDELLDEAERRLAELDSPMLRALLVGDDEATVTLYRPVGQKELDLIAESGYRRFPPRLPQQPIFYPVLNEEYATQIACDWNTTDDASGQVGYVTRFAVSAAYLQRHAVHQAGGKIHLEYWIPADELDEFNANITGPIEVIARFSPAD